MRLINIRQDRPLDVICLGRAGVDLYAEEPDVDMIDVAGFKKFVGGSPANIAVAIARQGGRAGIISCVSDDSLGRFVCHSLEGFGVDLQGMKIDKNGSRTSLAVTELKSSGCEVILYRNHASDLTLRPEQMDPDYIRQAKILLVTGTALSESPSREATLAAMQYARVAGTVVVLDLDYRAYSWQSPEESAVIYTIAAGQSDIVIGNREEFDVLEYLNGKHCTDDDHTAQQLLKGRTKIILLKAGEKGSKVYCADGQTFEQAIFPVDVIKPFGSGDSYAGTALLALIQGDSLKQAVRKGSAAAAINISRNTCTEAMPTTEELNAFLATHTEKH
ncbi:5-dehydro-2-deoxygluconokinase [invertebrate metagenome]|uniref:5-dehydro-2-deoxygluconokinase n=1 Tax=invertebrate metagenome TaxID=1711999 RepID=A0A2H9T6Y5_9ZZZZ